MSLTLFAKEYEMKRRKAAAVAGTKTPALSSSPHPASTSSPGPATPSSLRPASASTSRPATKSSLCPASTSSPRPALVSSPRPAATSSPRPATTSSPRPAPTSSIRAAPTKVPKVPNPASAKSSPGAASTTSVAAPGHGDGGRAKSSSLAPIFKPVTPGSKSSPATTPGAKPVPLPEDDESEPWEIDFQEFPSHIKYFKKLRCAQKVANENGKRIQICWRTFRTSILPSTNRLGKADLLGRLVSALKSIRSVKDKEKQVIINKAVHYLSPPESRHIPQDMLK